MTVRVEGRLTVCCVLIMCGPMCPYMWLCCSVFLLQLLPIHTLRLGVEVDSFDGHHYISSIVPGGPVDTLSLLQPEDELLEVKFIGGRKTEACMLKQ